MVAVNTGVVNDEPTKATVVKAASLYQVNVGLVTVVVVAVSVVFDPEQIVASAAVISEAVATGLTVIVTTLAVPGAFSHLLSPFTVT